MTMTPRRVQPSPGAGSNGSQLAPQAGTEGKSESKLIGLLRSPAVAQEIALALPKHVTAERLLRIALTEVRKNPKLAECDTASFLGAIMQCAQLGLEPGGSMGHAYLIPFKNNRKGITECQFMIGYRGMIDLARRSGQIVSISARTVHEGDEFYYCYGLDETISHVPSPSGRGDLLFVYAVAKLKDGGVQFEVMSREEVEEIRNSSQGYKQAVKYKDNSAPWIARFDEMARKTVIRKLFKYLPVSIELSQAVGLDEQNELGHAQDNMLSHMLPASNESLPVLVEANQSSAAVDLPPLSAEQLEVLRRTMSSRLGAVGQKAFSIEITTYYNVQRLEEVPAEAFSDVMGGLGNDGNCSAWARGKSADGQSQLVMLQEMEELEAQERKAVEAANDKAAPAPAAAARRAPAGSNPVTRQAVAPAPVEAEPASDPNLLRDMAARQETLQSEAQGQLTAPADPDPFEGQ